MAAPEVSLAVASVGLTLSCADLSRGLSAAEVRWVQCDVSGSWRLLRHYKVFPLLQQIPYATPLFRLQ
jgi:hypothetical protein